MPLRKKRKPRLAVYVERPKRRCVAICGPVVRVRKEKEGAIE